MSLSLQEDKIVKIKLECQLLLLEQDIVSARCLSKLNGRLTSTVLVILPYSTSLQAVTDVTLKSPVEGGSKLWLNYSDNRTMSGRAEIVESSSSSFIHDIYKQIHINDKFAQYNTLIVK